MLWLVCLFVVTVDAQYVRPSANNTRYPCTDQNHIVLVPGVLAAGTSNRACVSRFHPDGSAWLQITLVTEDKRSVSVERTLPPGDGGCLDISVPQLPNTKAEVHVRIRYPEAQCTWSSRLFTRVSGCRVVVVSTERARYRPGDTLRVRALALKPDLTPAHGLIDEVWLEPPRGSWGRAAQWQQVRSRMGLAQVTHKLDEGALPGKWTVRVRLGDGSQGATAFYVGDYELPPFQLSVRHSPRVLRSSERLVWTVCVRYPWTEAVEGMLVIRIRGAGTSSTGIRTAVRLRAPRACHRHAAAAKRVGLHGTEAPDVVVADFSFQEEGTRIWQNTTVVTQVVDKPVTLEFLTKPRNVISPGLSYKLKIKATRWDDKPSPNEKIRVCKSPASQEDLTTNATITDGQCQDAVTDGSGVARVMFTAGDDGSPFYRLQGFLSNDTSAATAPLFLPVLRKGSIHAALGPIRSDAFAARTFVPLYLSAKTITTAITVHFVVITRGGIIYRWGATTQCPVSSIGNQIQTTNRNAPCNMARLETNSPYNNTTFKQPVNNQDSSEDASSFNDNITNFKINDNTTLKTNSNINDRNAVTNDEISKIEAKSDSLLDRQMLRVMLPIKVTHQMCPDSHMVAYFYHNGELISASKHFDMDECFANKVEATWQSRQTAPSSTATLSINTPGPALCSLTAIDSAAKHQDVKDLVMKSLRRLIEGQRNMTEYDAAGECFWTSDTPDQPSSNTELMLTWLASAGVRVLGGETTVRFCRPAPAPMMSDEVVLPRSDFSEAWLWRLVPVGANGTAVTSAQAPDSITRFEATALCIARNGLGISPPAVLQVFREFFIHADSPKKLRRGDSAILRYRIFNYLYEPLSIQVQILTDSHVETSDNTETACIAARSSIARRVEIRAKLPGNGRINVRAKSVKDGNCANTTMRTGVSDEVILQMEIDHEGIPVYEQKSALLCAKGSIESSSSKASWNWPEVKAVPGTEMITVWTLADVVGPLLADADDLVTLPRGCGEQNMARLATNLLALTHLDPRAPAAFIAREHVSRGFTRQLQYVHPSGGFSAFGATDSMPSTWLTAFAVRYLRKAHQLLSPTSPLPPALVRAEQWLLSQQMENGCFRNQGQVFHREMRGGLNEDGEIANIALTAYVITSLLDLSNPLPSHTLTNSLSCLRALPTTKTKTKNPAKIYAQSLVTYAFMKLKRYEDEVKSANEASLLEREGLGGEEMRGLRELLKIAERGEEDVWWETDSLSTSVESTAYALLALSHCPPHLREPACAHDARAAVTWLSKHRNAAGGFVATQDTLIALEALLSWSSVQPSPHTNLNMTVQSVSAKRTVNVRSEVKVPDLMKMGEGRKVSVNVEGTGCALVQATRSYHTYTPENHSPQLSVQMSVHTDGPFNCDNDTSCFCAAVVEACVVWTGVFPEMALLEVALPGGFGADPSLLYSQLKETDILLRRIELTPTSGRVTLYLGSRDGDILDRGGHRCYSIHAVGPRAKTKPAHAKITDYYNPAATDTQMYTIPEECLPRISHEHEEYSTSDNLFNKAKSLGDELIISHEYVFEDIPDGIPLDDPLYDFYKEDIALSNTDDVHASNINVKNNKGLVNFDVKHNIDDKIYKIDDAIETNNNRYKISETKRNQYEVNNVKNSNINDGDENQEIDKRIKLENGNEAIDVIRRQSKTEQEVTTEPAKEISTNQTEVIKTPEEHKIQIREDSKEHDQEIAASNLKTENTNIKLKDAYLETTVRNPEVENPNLSHFHVIDTDKDLEVPTGVEGPVPSVLLPPPNMNSPRSYLVPPTISSRFDLPYNPYISRGRPPGGQRKSFDRRPVFFYRSVYDPYWRNIRYR